MGRPGKLRRFAAILHAGALACCAGCFCPIGRPTHLIERWRPPTPAAADVVVLDVAPLEVSVADGAIIQTIWSAADEQSVAPDLRARLDDNGFRVGVVGGLPPPALLELLTSQRSNPEPHQWRRKAGDPRWLKLGGIIPECRFNLVLDGATTPIVLDQAQCGLQVTPSITPDAVSLLFEPQVHHGRKSLWPATDGAGNWVVQGQSTIERWPELRFDVSLSESEYLILGAREKPETLGAACFRTDGDRPRLRLVVIRASKAVPGSESLANGDRNPPLATQAASTRVRGVAGP